MQDGQADNMAMQVEDYQSSEQEDENNTEIGNGTVDEEHDSSSESFDEQIEHSDVNERL